MSESGDSLLPPEWDELAPLLDAVLDAPLEQRDAILDELSNGDPDRPPFTAGRMGPYHGGSVQRRRRKLDLRILPHGR